MPPPRSPIRPEARRAVDLLSRRWQAFTDLRALADINVERGDQKQRLSGVILAKGPDGVRFEAGPGFPLGALEALAQTPRWYAARTLTPVVALQVQPDMLVDLFEDNFEMAMDYLALVSSATLRILAWKAEQDVGSETELEDWSSPDVLAAPREAD